MRSLSSEFGLRIGDVEAGSIDLRINMRCLGMPSACRADIADRSYIWQNPNHTARILSVGEVRIMLAKEFNGHDMGFCFKSSPPASRLRSLKHDKTPAGNYLNYEILAGAVPCGKRPQRDTRS